MKTKYTKYDISPASGVLYGSKPPRFDSVQEAREYNGGQFANKLKFQIDKVEITEEIDKCDVDPISDEELKEEFCKIDFQHKVQRRIFEIVTGHGGPDQYDHMELMALEFQVAYDLQMDELILNSIKK